MSVLVLFGFLLRLASMLAYYPSILYIDSYDYIVRAYTLDPTGNDPVGYSVFLRVMLKFSNLSTVVAVQHLLGLGMAIAIYALLRRYGIRRWLCALAVAPLLLDAYQVQIEQNILSDALYETLAVAGIVVFAWYRNPPMWAYPIGGALLGMAVPVRTVGETLFLGAVAFSLTVARGRRRKAAAVVFTVVGFAAPIAGYAGYYYSMTGSPGIAGQGYNNMYGRAAMVANCAELPLTPQERVLCPTQPLGQRIGIDYYINGPSSPLMQQKYRELYGEPHIDVPQATSGFVDEVLTHQFGAFARSVLDDFVHSFSPQSHVSAAVVPASRWQFQTVYPVYPPGFTLGTAAVVDALGGQGPIHMNVALAGDLRAYQMNGGSTPGPLLGLFTLLGVVCCCSWSMRVKASRLRPLCLLVTLAGLVPLFVSDLFQYTVRYQMPATVILPAAGVIGLSALLYGPEQKIETAVVVYGGERHSWINGAQVGEQQGGLSAAEESRVVEAEKVEAANGEVVESEVAGAGVDAVTSGGPAQMSGPGVGEAEAAGEASAESEVAEASGVSGAGATSAANAVSVAPVESVDEVTGAAAAVLSGARSVEALSPEPWVSPAGASSETNGAANGSSASAAASGPALTRGEDHGPNPAHVDS